MVEASLIGRIIDGLAERPAGAAGQAVKRARSAFLEWACGLPRDADVRRAARAALAAVDRADTADPAVAVFRSYLEEATRALPAPVRRGGRRRYRHAAHGAWH